jgi:putative ABC transport system permease protein
LWRSLFGEDPSVVGRKIEVNGVPLSVAAVLDPSFRGIIFSAAYTPEIWVSADGAGIVPRASVAVLMKARSAPGVPAARALAALNSATAFLQARRILGPETRVFARPGGVAHVPPGIELWARTAAAYVAVAAAALLVVACINVAMVLLSSSIERRVEYATRVALGAGRWSTVRDALAEPLLISTIAGALALVFAWGAAAAIAAQRPEVTQGVAVVVAPSIDSRVALFVAVAVALAALCCAIAPAWAVGRADVAPLLAGGAAVTRRRPRLRIEDLLLVFHLTATVVLVCLAIELVAGLVRHRTEDLGGRTERLAFARLRPVPAGPALYRAGQMLAALRQRPEIGDAALSSALPFEGEPGCQSAIVDGDAHRACSLAVGDGYFATVGVRILRGRAPVVFTAEGEDPAAVVSAAASAAWWPVRDPIGQRFMFGGRQLRVAAVAEDVELGAAVARTMPVVYLPLEADAGAAVYALARGRRDARGAAQAIQATVRDAASGFAATQIMTFSAYLDRGPLYPLRLASTAASAVAGIALLVSTFGLYTVLMRATARRRKEFAVRTSLGATAPLLARAAIGREIVIVALALALGLWMAWGATAALNAAVSRDLRFDWTASVAAALLVAAAALLACIVPARRAWRQPPAVVLREA